MERPNALGLRQHVERALAGGRGAGVLRHARAELAEKGGIDETVAPERQLARNDQPGPGADAGDVIGDGCGRAGQDEAKFGQFSGRRALLHIGSLSLIHDVLKRRPQF